MLVAMVREASSRKLGPALDLYFTHEDALARGWKHGQQGTVRIDDAVLRTTIANTRSSPRRWNLHSPRSNSANLRDVVAAAGFASGDTLEFAEEPGNTLGLIRGS